MTLNSSILPTNNTSQSFNLLRNFYSEKLMSCYILTRTNLKETKKKSQKKIAFHISEIASPIILMVVLSLAFMLSLHSKKKENRETHSIIPKKNV